MAFFELPRLNWRRVVTIVRKELLVLLCNRVSRVLIIVPPLMQIDRRHTDRGRQAQHHPSGCRSCRNQDSHSVLFEGYQ